MPHPQPSPKGGGSKSLPPPLGEGWGEGSNIMLFHTSITCNSSFGSFSSSVRAIAASPAA